MTRSIDPMPLVDAAPPRADAVVRAIARPYNGNDRRVTAFVLAIALMPVLLGAYQSNSDGAVAIVLAIGAAFVMIAVIGTIVGERAFARTLRDGAVWRATVERVRSGGRGGPVYKLAFEAASAPWTGSVSSRGARATSGDLVWVLVDPHHRRRIYMFGPGFLDVGAATPGAPSA